MPLSFSLHKQSQGLHWYVSKQMGDKQLAAIIDLNTKFPTAADNSGLNSLSNLDRVRTAFQRLADRQNLSGTSQDQRLVSDSLDVGELFFNYSKFQNSIDIQSIDIQYILGRLQRSTDLGHLRLGQLIIEHFNEKDTPHSKLDFPRLFAIQVGQQLVGGTSPTTLFFASGRSSPEKPLYLQNRILFDSVPVALYQRDIFYQKYWYTLRQQIPNFRLRFRAVDDYLARNLTLLKQYQPDLYTEHIESFSGQSRINSGSYFTDFSELKFVSGDQIDIGGFILRQKKPDTPLIDSTSDFIIKSPKYERLNPGIPRPMVLQNHFNRPYTYVPQINWNPDIWVPYVCEESWRNNKRVLPGQLDIYPWLTVSDFLEPYLIRLPFPTNRDHFFGGTFQPSGLEKGYLLPLKIEFFDFFDVQDLLSGNVQLKLVPQGPNVLVSLRIPIIAINQSGNHFITFERLYLAQYFNYGQPDEEMNVGQVIEHSVTVNIFPFLRAGRVAIPVDYRVEFIESGFDSEFIYQLDYFLSDNNFNIRPASRHQRTVRQQNTDGSSFVDVVRKEFDFCQITVNQDELAYQAVLIPKWILYHGGSKQFSFSVDFGTTSTHIEYSVDGGVPRPFETLSLTPIVTSLVHPDQNNPALFELFLLFNLEFVPPFIGPGYDDRFPTRTALAERMNLRFDQQTETLADFNIPFYVDYQPAGSNRISTNLKWDQSSEQGQRRAEAFLEELLMLIRNKVLSEGGDLSQTIINWLYPSSMTPGRVSMLRADWQRLYQQYIGKNTSRLHEMLESIAPFYYYRQNLTLSSSVRPVVSIDIGGGTSDVVVFQANEPVLLTSFRFAGNAVYGDAFNEYGAASHNGFVRKYANRIQDLLDSQSLGDLSDNNRHVFDTNRSEDIMNFWFSIERSNHVRNKQLLSFHRMLARDQDLKIVFVLFLCALLYHVARLLKFKGIDLPGAITFSGSGSKILPVTSPDNNLLGKLAQLIFEGVYQKPSSTGPLSFTYENRHPKELTCKGALLRSAYSRAIDSESINFVYPATFNDEYSSLTYSDVREPKVIKLLLKETNSFIDFFFELNQQFSFVKNLNVSDRSLVIAQQEIRKHLDSSLMDGIKCKEGELMNEHDELMYVLELPVEETMFFYPLIGAMNKLALKLV